jgi:hypothetical protein
MNERESGESLHILNMAEKELNAVNSLQDVTVTVTVTKVSELKE